VERPDPSLAELDFEHLLVPIGYLKNRFQCGCSRNDDVSESDLKLDLLWLGWGLRAGVAVHPFRLRKSQKFVVVDSDRSVCYLWEEQEGQDSVLLSRVDSDAFALAEDEWVDRNVCDSLWPMRD
jgi:hypothetical protein